MTRELSPAVRDYLAADVKDLLWELYDAAPMKEQGMHMFQMVSADILRHTMLPLFLCEYEFSGRIPDLLDSTVLIVREDDTETMLLESEYLGWLKEREK